MREVAPSGTVRVRKAQAEDAPAIRACLESAFEPFRCRYTPEAFSNTVLTMEALKQRLRQMTVYVAVDTHGRIIGTLAWELNGTEGHLRGMAVQPAWQGSLVGETLLRAAECDLRAAGCVQLTLHTTAPLQRAIRFYEKNAFVASSRVVDFFGMPLHEYAKRLPP